MDRALQALYNEERLDVQQFSGLALLRPGSGCSHMQAHRIESAQPVLILQGLNPST